MVDNDEQLSNVKEKPAWALGDSEMANVTNHDKELTVRGKRDLKEENEWLSPVRGSRTNAAPPSHRVLRSKTRALAQSADTLDPSPVGRAEDAVPTSSIVAGPSHTPGTSSSATNTTTTTTTAVSSAKDNITTVNKRRREVWITKTES